MRSVSQAMLLEAEAKAAAEEQQGKLQEAPPSVSLGIGVWGLDSGFRDTLGFGLFWVWGLGYVGFCSLGYFGFWGAWLQGLLQGFRLAEGGLDNLGRSTPCASEQK